MFANDFNVLINVSKLGKDETRAVAYKIIIPLVFNQQDGFDYH